MKRCNAIIRRGVGTVGVPVQTYRNCKDPRPAVDVSAAGTRGSNSRHTSPLLDRHLLDRSLLVQCRFLQSIIILVPLGAQLMTFHLRVPTCPVRSQITEQSTHGSSPWARSIG
jgi:hypothetical protein